jgi:hypothetical protein
MLTVFLVLNKMLQHFGFWLLLHSFVVGNVFVSFSVRFNKFYFSRNGLHMYINNCSTQFLFVVKFCLKGGKHNYLHLFTAEKHHGNNGHLRHFDKFKIRHSDSAPASRSLNNWFQRSLHKRKQIRIYLRVQANK